MILCDDAVVLKRRSVECMICLTLSLNTLANANLDSVLALSVDVEEEEEEEVDVGAEVMREKDRQKGQDVTELQHT